MELYISDHPLDCLTCAANGDCELQDMAGVTGLRDVRYGYGRRCRRQPPRRADRHLQPLLPVRGLEVHRVLALRARVRRGAGHARADHPGARLRLEGRRRAGRVVLRLRLRVVRGLRAGLPDRHAAPRRRSIELGVPTRTVLTTCAYCGRRLLVQGRAGKGDQLVRMVPDKDGGANEGHSCVKGRFAFGYATHAERVHRRR